MLFKFNQKIVKPAQMEANSGFSSTPLEKKSGLNRTKNFTKKVTKDNDKATEKGNVHVFDF